MDAVAPNDVWAAGFTTSPTTTPFVMHWDGSQWTSIDSFRSLNGTVRTITAYSANDVWVAGQGGSSYPTLYHWDGTSWSPVSVPNPGGTIREFNRGIAV